MGFERVGAKTHPDIEWTFTAEGQPTEVTFTAEGQPTEPTPAPAPTAGVGAAYVYQGSGMGGGGIGRPLTAGARPEPLS